MNGDYPDLEVQIEHLEGLLTAAAHERHALLDQLARYRTALVKIADANSGHWGRLAFIALHPEREPEP